ncbi:MAG: hypothetical protein IT302_02785 [Dehalococcoidia bacterium]|nr:hypothetical protein [Dehalococcoidia bacterium]
MRRPALLALLLPLPFAALPLLAIAVTHLDHRASAGSVVIQRPAGDEATTATRPTVERTGWNDDAVSSRDCDQDDIYAGT